MTESQNNNTNTQQENQVKKRRAHFGQPIDGKWNRVVAVWTGHYSCENHSKATGLMKALKRAGYVQIRCGYMRDRRVKVWTVGGLSNG